MAMAGQPVVIKKYGNRRLYDTSGSRYVNLEDIAALVRNGNDVQVLDAKTGDDLTRVTLTQIILEDAKGQSSGLPLEMLRQMIVATDRAGRDFIMSYLKSAFEAYQRVHDTVQSGLSGMQAVARSPLQAVRSLIQGPAEPFQKKESTEHPSTPFTELEQLRKRMAELEQKLNRPARRKGLNRKKKVRHNRM